MFVDYQKIKASKDFPAYIRSLADNAISGGYVNPSQFFRDLHEDDLSGLLAAADKEFGDPSANKEAMTIMLLTIMLSSAEGIYPEDYSEDDDDISSFYAQAVGMTRAFIALESLNRKGMVEVNYEAFTYDPSCKKVIAKPKDF